MNRILYTLMGTLLLAACQPRQEQRAAEPVARDSAAVTSAATAATSDATAVQDSASVFRTMGKVMATRYADVKYEASLPVKRVMVHNGDRVRKGQLIAELDAYRQANAIEQHQREMEQARLQMEDVIIAQGYDPQQMDRVPANVRHIAEVKSGYLLAQSRLAAARHELSTTRVVAPFDGVVANVTGRTSQLAQVGEVVCRIISEQQMDVVFQVVETDLGRFPKGTVLSIQPIADPSSRYEARVTEINPMVDEQGTVTIRSRLSLAGTLFDGMHVAVFLNEEP